VYLLRKLIVRMLLHDYICVINTQIKF